MEQKSIAGFRILLLRCLVRIVLTNGANLYLMLNMMYWKMQYDMEERALSEGESITYKTWEHKENILRDCRERTLMGLHTV